MKKLIILPILFLLLTACNDEVEWKMLDDGAQLESISEFMMDYFEGWSESLTSSFSIMENYFVPNSHVFHMQRRHHQQLISERKVEYFVEAIDPVVEYNDHEEFRLTWIETIEIHQGEETMKEERQRAYYISEGRQGYRITKIERLDD
ncbi:MULTISPECIES: TcaA NTF2-like domain-containing protein [Bacillaceae]|uniref:Uncharacterized protein n=1 Tax=Evansella alkalicola TaxID=745819 RepID=A0ABS6K1U6_9BACI|nr:MULTISPECIES: hypothetical protein [Bacillaceae]MBU9723899.1 hypothetical protein [Bacillus alkalicola]